MGLYTLTSPNALDAFAPLAVTLRTLTDSSGLADPIVVTDRTDWTPAASLLGAGLPMLIDTAQRRWNAAPHAAATLAWKSYCYWLSMPAVLSWAAARRVPLIDANNVLVKFTGTRLQIGLASAAIAVLPDDPLAHSGRADVTVVADEEILLKTLRINLLERHLDPLSERIRAEVKVGRRTLLGSIASGISYAVMRAGFPEDVIETLLASLDLSDLVELVPTADGSYGVQRRTCCLAFTLPEPKVCSGCCLRC